MHVCRDVCVLEKERKKEAVRKSLRGPLKSGGMQNGGDGRVRFGLTETESERDLESGVWFSEVEDYRLLYFYSMNSLSQMFNVYMALISSNSTLRAAAPSTHAATHTLCSTRILTGWNLLFLDTALGDEEAKSAATGRILYFLEEKK